MPILVSTQTGNWTSSSTWNVVNDASYFVGTSTTTVTVGGSNSLSFTPGAVTLSGISVLLAGRANVPAGTYTVSLVNVTANTVVAGTSVVTNVSDIPNTNGDTTYLGWVFFKFDAPVTLAAATTYAVRMSTSNGGQISAYRSSTNASDWSRALVTTTNAAPTTGDTIFVQGSISSTGVTASTIVTMNNTVSATTFSAVTVGVFGTLNYGTSPSTNYHLRIRGGALTIGTSSLFQIGTESTPIPSSSLATLEFSGTTAGLYFLNYAGTFNAYGSPLTYISAKLSEDVTSGSTTTITDSPTGWNVGDTIIVPTTTTTVLQQDVLTITGITGTTIRHRPYTFSHGGNSTTLVQADVVNLTRNVKIFSNTIAGRTFNFSSGYASTIPSTYNIYYSELYDIGGVSNSTGGLQLNNFTNLNMSGCSFYTSLSGQGLFSVVNRPPAPANVGIMNIYDSIFYNTGIGILYSEYLSGSTILNNLYFIQNTAGITQRFITGTYTNLTFAGNTDALSFGQGSANVIFGQTVSNCNFYGNTRAVNANGWYIGNININNSRFWRNPTIYSSTQGLLPRNRFSSIIFNNCDFFGNPNGIGHYAANRIIFNDSYFWGGTGITQFAALSLASAFVAPTDAYYFNRCYFGVDRLGNSSPFTLAAINTVYPNGTSAIFTNCIFSGTAAANQNTPPFGIISTYAPFGYLSLNHNNIPNSNILFTSMGRHSTDTDIFYNSRPSLRLTPASSTQKLRTNIFRVPVQSGQSCNVSVWVRKSGAFDTQSYNGAQPRLMYVYNSFAGNNEELVATSIPNSVNIFSFPEDFSNAYWTKTGLNTTGTPPWLNVDTAPINPFSTTVDALIEDTSNNVHGIVQNFAGGTFVVGSYYTFSCYVKRILRNFFSISVNSSINLAIAGQTPIYNLTASTVTNVPTSDPSVSASIQSLGNDWFRCSLTLTARTNSGTSYFVPNNGSNITYVGTGGTACYLWGAQLETGTTATQYVPDGLWQQLNYTTPVSTATTTCEFFIDCDGTTGWINIDDWNTTTLNNTKGGGYWGFTGQYIEPNYRNPGGSNTFIT